MKFFDTDSLHEIWATITRNKFRSVATGFGVFWGLFMLIVLLAIGNRITQNVIAQVDGFATNSVFIWSGRTTEPYKGYRKGRWWSFQMSDLPKIRERSQLADIISPAIQMRTGDKGVVRGVKSGGYQVNGVYPEYFKIQTVGMVAGRMLNEVDIESRRKVCVIGETVYETLFNPGENAIGEFIRINGIYFQVIGVVEPVSSASIFGRVEEMVMLPFTVHQTLFGRGDEFYFLAVTSKKGVKATDAEAEVKRIIREIKDISPTDGPAVGGVNVEHQFNMFNMLFLGINFLMWMVGLGALMSGIIGISNIMLVTVRERMREIGVRRALGAKPWNIIVQIMSESFLLTAIAGMIGLMLGLAVSLVVEKVVVFDPTFVPTDPAISFGLAVTAMVVLILSGVAAGLLPAWRALKIKAIDAIRDE